MSAEMEEKPTPADEARRLYEEAEARTARAMEELVGRDAFGEVLARVTENALALAKLGGDAADMVVRNLRVAGRRDITALARQLARTEDKLERVLQEVEGLRDAVDAAGRDGAAAGGANGARGGADSARAARAAATRSSATASSTGRPAARRAGSRTRKESDPAS
jgi:hypothetical protein